MLLCLGLDFKRGGFVDRALEAFNEVRRLDPSNQYALLYLQKLHEEQHQWDDALSDPPAARGADRAGHEAAEPGDSRLPRERARDQSMKAGALDEAVRRFESAIDLDPATTPAYLEPRGRDAGNAATAPVPWPRGNG